MKKERGKMLKDVVKRNRSKLHEIAEKNTVRNSDGLPVASKNDPWREDESNLERNFSYKSEMQSVLI